MLQSRGSPLVAGRIYTPDAQIEISDGGAVSLVLPSGEIRSVHGPFKGVIADLEGSATESAPLWTAVVSFIKRGMSSEDTTGGTRAVDLNAGLMHFSWTIVPSAIEGNVCVDGRQELLLKRPPLASVNRITLLDTEGGRAQVEWPEGSDMARWPAELPAASNRDYMVLIPGLPMRQLTLRFMDNGMPPDSQVLQALAAKGCAHQIEAWLQDRLGPDWKPETVGQQ